MSPANPVYLLVPNEANERVLHPGRLMQETGEEVVVLFDQAVAPAPGADVILYFEDRGKFMQQGAQITAVREAHPAPTDAAPIDAAPTDPAPTDAAPVAPSAPDAQDSFTPVQAVVFNRVGQPISAESRGSFRVSVVAMNLTARFDKERNCKIADVSPEGLALITKQSYRLGTLAPLSWEFGGQLIEGRVRVQTVKPLPRGKFRCGLLIPSLESAMRTAMQKITADVQRQQLRRIRQSA